jgi:hypothetical protein
LFFVHEPGLVVDEWAAGIFKLKPSGPFPRPAWIRVNRNRCKLCNAKSEKPRDRKIFSRLHTH